jgi:hypothetical protein
VHTQAEAVDAFRRDLVDNPERLALARSDLAGQNLACWCALDEPCHADVLLELVNRRTPGRAERQRDAGRLTR